MEAAPLDTWLSRSREKTTDETDTEKCSLNRSPHRWTTATPEGVERVKLSREAQALLGCVVNEDVYLECPYAYVPRQALLEVSRREDTTLHGLSGRIAASTADWLLVGYAEDKITGHPDGADFAICTSKEACRAVAGRNRWITLRLREGARRQVERLAGPWREGGSAAEIASPRPVGPTRELDLLVPVAELLRPRDLADARDTCAELAPEEADNHPRVDLARLAGATQTHLGSRHSEAQTYPARPTNQWTQHELEVPREFADLWAHQQQEEEVTKDEVEDEEAPREEGDGDDNSSPDGPKKELVSEEALRLAERRRLEWSKLAGFATGWATEIDNTVSFNASINLHVNDAANLRGDAPPAGRPAIGETSYPESTILLDLDTIGKTRYLLAASWHPERTNFLACAYLDPTNDTLDDGLVALWILSDPLRPKFLLKCDQRVSALSFCPIGSYSSILVGGCLDGSIVVWEIPMDWLESSGGGGAGQPPRRREATIAVSSDGKSHASGVTGIRWLRVGPSSPRPYFATSSGEGGLYLWSLPRSLASPPRALSPLRLALSPVHRLTIGELNDPVTSFHLPWDSSARRTVFVGTAGGEVARCASEEADGESEPCLAKPVVRCTAHDGRVRTLARCDHLEDVFLSVGGRVFALWKEDMPEGPFYRRRSDARLGYGEGCWSTGKPGTIGLARLDGSFEVWDLKRNSGAPLFLRIISNNVTPYIFFPSPGGSGRDEENQWSFAVLDGPSSLRIFADEGEDEGAAAERIEWLEEFAWRETRRKLEFHRWQDEYLGRHPTALRRRAERERAELARRHREARDKFVKILGIICLILGSSSPYAAGGWFTFVVVVAFIVTCLWSVIYLLSVRESLKIPINWLLSELFNTGIFTILYFTAFVCELAVVRGAVYVAAGVFGLFNTLAYAAGTYYLYLEHVGSQR